MTVLLVAELDTCGARASPILFQASINGECVLDGDQDLDLSQELSGVAFKTLILIRLWDNVSSSSVTQPSVVV